MFLPTIESYIHLVGGVLTLNTGCRDVTGGNECGLECNPCGR